jgi:hypothetical protein
MADSSRRRNPEWDARYKARKAGELPPPQTCSSCGVKMRSGAAERGGLCSRCWLRQTEEGRARNREWTRRVRERQKQRQAEA